MTGLVDEAGQLEIDGQDTAGGTPVEKATYLWYTVPTIDITEYIDMVVRYFIYCIEVILRFSSVLRSRLSVWVQGRLVRASHILWLAFWSLLWAWRRISRHRCGALCKMLHRRLMVFHDAFAPARYLSLNRLHPQMHLLRGYSELSYKKANYKEFDW